MSHYKRNTAMRNRLRARFKAEGASCYICGKPIDFDLRSPDPMSFELDHRTALARGGADTAENGAASHRTCNRAKGVRDFAPIVRRSGGLK